MDGWIKLYRKLLEWEWFKNPPTLSVFLYLLLSANIENKKWRGIVVKRGQVVASLEKISNATGLSIRQVRTAINHLETSQSATKTSYSKYTVFTILNYDEYQEATQSSTNKRQASDKQTTSKRQASDNNIRIKEYKKERTKEDTPPTPSRGAGEGFDEFWKAYPKKVAKAQAQKAWNRIKPNAELQQIILSALEWQKQSAQWQKDNGQYIPYPATWLNNRRWEDVQKQPVQAVQPSPQVSDFDPNDPYKDWGNGNV